jgi:transposase
LTRIRSALKNRVGAILAKHGIERAHSDLFGPAGRRFLAGLELRDAPRRRLDSLIALVDDLTREIDAGADADPYVEVLCQIRGVGRYIAMLIIAEVGDISRFPSARHLCSWAALAPTVRNSDQRIRLGDISRQGSPTLRWALVEAAQHAGRGRNPLRARYDRLAKRRGKQVAKVAIAREILTLCYYGLRDGEIRRLAPRVKARPIRPLAVKQSPAVPQPAPSTAGRIRARERARVLSMTSPEPTSPRDGRPLD